MATRADVEQVRFWLQALRMTALVGLSRENVAEHAEDALEIIDAARLAAQMLHVTGQINEATLYRLFDAVGIEIEVEDA